MSPYSSDFQPPSNCFPTGAPTPLPTRFRPGFQRLPTGVLPTPPRTPPPRGRARGALTAPRLPSASSDQLWRKATWIVGFTEQPLFMQPIIAQSESLAAFFGVLATYVA